MPWCGGRCVPFPMDRAINSQVWLHHRRSRLHQPSDWEDREALEEEAECGKDTKDSCLRSMVDVFFLSYLKNSALVSTIHHPQVEECGLLYSVIANWWSKGETASQSALSRNVWAQKKTWSRNPQWESIRRLLQLVHMGVSWNGGIPKPWVAILKLA